MPKELIELITQSGPNVIVVSIFIWYLTNRDKLDQKDRQKVTEVITETTRVNEQLTSKVEELTKIIHTLYKKLLEKNNK